jgi:hypothetical protein
MPNRFWVGGTGTWDSTSTTNWSATTGGAGGASAPTAVDDVFFDANSGTAATVTIQASASGRAATVGKSDITLLLAGSPTLAGIFTFTQGTLDLAGNNLTVLRFLTSNSNTRTIAFGAGLIVVTGNNATVVGFVGTGLTLTGSKNIVSNYSGATGTRTFSMSSAGTTEDNVPNIAITAGTDTVAGFARVRTLDFTGFKGTYNSAAIKNIFGSLIFDPGMTITGSANNHAFAGTSGPYTITTAGLTLDFPMQFSGNGGTWAFSDALTQGATRTFIVGFTGVSNTVKLKAGVTSTVGVFSTSGTLQKYLQSTLAGSQATLSQASGTVSVSSLTIQDINATGGASWNAYVDFDNEDAGNNDGWNFGLSPPFAAYEPPIIIRSFTQPRRF